jgi:hypothetical protein
MAHEQLVAHELLSMLKGLTAHEPQSECVSAQLKRVTVLDEAVC